MKKFDIIYTYETGKRLEELLTKQGYSKVKDNLYRNNETLIGVVDMGLLIQCNNPRLLLFVGYDHLFVENGVLRFKNGGEHNDLYGRIGIDIDTEEKDLKKDERS